MRIDDCAVNDSAKTVNRFDMYRHERHTEIELDKRIQEAYAIGYVFILEGKAYTLIGTVIDLDQTQEAIGNMEETVDLTIQALRSIGH